MKRKRTVTRFNLFLTTGNTVEILADEVEPFSTDGYTWFRKESKLVGRFLNNAILGYTREDIDDERQNDDKTGD